RRDVAILQPLLERPGNERPERGEPDGKPGGAPESVARCARVRGSLRSRAKCEVRSALRAVRSAKCEVRGINDVSFGPRTSHLAPRTSRGVAEGPAQAECREEHREQEEWEDVSGVRAARGVKIEAAARDQEPETGAHLDRRHGPPADEAPYPERGRRQWE